MLYGAKHRTSFVNILSIQVSVMVISHVKSSVICPRTNLMMRTVLYRASTTWNTLAFSIRLTKSRHSFKYLLKKTLMNPQWLAIKKHSWVQESTATRYHIDIKKYIEEHGHTYTGSHFLSKSDNSTIQCPCSLFSKRSLAVGPHSLSGGLTAPLSDRGRPCLALLCRSQNSSEWVLPSPTIPTFYLFSGIGRIRAGRQETTYSSKRLNPLQRSFTPKAAKILHLKEKVRHALLGFLWFSCCCLSQP